MSDIPVKAQGAVFDYICESVADVLRRHSFDGIPKDAVLVGVPDEKAVNTMLTTGGILVTYPGAMPRTVLPTGVYLDLEATFQVAVGTPVNAFNAPAPSQIIFAIVGIVGREVFTVPVVDGDTIREERVTLRFYQDAPATAATATGLTAVWHTATFKAVITREMVENGAC